MNKTYLIFKHEFIHTIKRSGWIIMTLIIPVLAGLGIGVYALIKNLSEPTVPEIRTIGYVDEVGIFNDQTTQGYIKLVPYASREDANQSLARYEISEFIIIPVDYISSGTIQRYTLEKESSTSPATIATLKKFLSMNLLKDKVPDDVVTRVLSPLNLEVTRITPEGDQSLEQNNIGNLIIPGIFSLMLGLALMFGATSIITGLGEEKESRLIEVLFSSVSVRQLLIGKVLALGTAGLLQVLVWLISTPLLLYLTSSTTRGFLSQIEIPGNFLILGIVYFILGYLLFAVLSIGVGAISSNAREGSQLSMIYTLGSFVPLWFLSLLMFFPNSAIWTVLTIFPITAPVQAMVRLGVSEIPLWEIMTSIGVLVLSIVGGLFLSIKIFRMNMLMHGKNRISQKLFVV